MENKQDEQADIRQTQESLQQEYGLLSPVTVFSEWRQQLITEVDRLIHTDFNRLISILYRLDVPETKLKYLLQQNPADDAAAIITDLIIERQLQKIKSRRQFSRRDDNISEEDKW